MEKMKRVSILLVLCLVLTLLPVSRASATDYASGLWLRQVPMNEGVTIAVCTDAVVASGVITITYNKDVLAFTELKVDSAYVLAHAFNDKEAGTVQISWIGTGKQSNADGYVLMWLVFDGPADLSAVMTGMVYDADGNTLAITTLNLTSVTAAIMQAETLKEGDYTADSFAAMQTAMQTANALLEQVAVTQAQLDAAVQKLTDAMENLVAATPEPPATGPAPTEPKPTDPKPTDPKPTQPTGTVTGPVVTDPVPKKNDTLLIVAALALCAVVVAAVVILKKRGRK